MQIQEASAIKNYTDREGLEEHARNSILFIHISDHFLKIVVASPSRSAVYALRVLEQKNGNLLSFNSARLKQMYETLKIPHADYSSVQMVVHNAHHSFVPEALFAGEKAASFLKPDEIHPHEIVLFNRLAKNRVSVFSMPGEVHTAMRELYPEAAIHHAAQLFIAAIPAGGEHHADQLFVNIHERQVDIASLKNNDLQFLNSFPYEGDTDIVYYVLSVAELLRLNPDKLHVSLSGHVSATGSLTGLLKKYIPFVDFVKREARFAYPASFREFAAHEHFLEISSLLCVS